MHLVYVHTPPGMCDGQACTLKECMCLLAGWDIFGFATLDRNTSQITTSVVLHNVALLRTYCIPVQWVLDPAVSRDIQARRPQAAFPGVQVVTPLLTNMTYCFIPQPTSSVPAGPPAVAGGARRLQARTQPPLGAPARRLLYQGPDEEAGPAAVVGAHAAIEGPMATNQRCWPATAGWLVRDGAFEAVQIDAGGAGSYAGAHYWFVLRGAHALCDYVSDVACVRQYGADNCEVARVEVVQPPSAAALAAGPGAAAPSGKSSRDVLPIVLPCVLGGELPRQFPFPNGVYCLALPIMPAGAPMMALALALCAMPPAEHMCVPTYGALHCTALHYPWHWACRGE